MIFTHDLLKYADELLKCAYQFMAILYSWSFEMCSQFKCKGPLT